MKLTKENVELIEQFAKHCIKELSLKGSIKIILSRKQTGMPTAGYFNPDNGDVFVAVNNRARADIMRTIAHELTHRKQKQNDVIFPEDDKSLQPLEDEANVMSGRLVRFYGRQHREIYADLMLEGILYRR